MNKDSWLLPEGIEEVLPPHAEYLEARRRQLLDLYRGWGYELVLPPFIEYLESLFVGTAHDLDLQTFKLTDQLNGRMMGVRADITPQVARIDAHKLRRETPTRLCYMGTVLRTRPDGFGASRAPLQLGLELYGHPGVESDVEVFRLMVETLRTCGIENTYFDLGHVGIFRGLTKQAGLSTEQEAELFDALQRKAKPEIGKMLAQWQLDKNIAGMLSQLADLNGGDEVLPKAQAILAKAGDEVNAALNGLQQMARNIKQALPDISLHYDLAELRGYHYHTGVVFAAFVPGKGTAVAQGGRYDGIGKAFGNARPATGFSTDLKTLLALAPATVVKSAGIYAPYVQSPELEQLIQSLRAQGERVVSALPGQQGDAQAMRCDREIVQQGKQWVVKQI
ncbi:MAG: ATP phosphoribosyltransferase regulatory subunit [Gammaproteobacteria bacterium]|nr:ATP phosphoribosyltransferase regulatory subunit [Gammaproteobacteria bacterium]